ncbi:MAG TPA: hypothetical protein VFS96_01175 [Nitrolancea sp.]|nr:hypothetical protein [Nitrolancea sp.]
MIASAVCGLPRRSRIDGRPPAGVWTVAGRYDRDGISSSALNRGNSSGDEAGAMALMGWYGATFVFEEATASGCALVIFMN